jgi:secreted trypsin-like serine protease
VLFTLASGGLITGWVAGGSIVAMSTWVRLFVWVLVSGSLFWLLLTTEVTAAPLRVINGADVPAGEQPWVVGILQTAVDDDYLAQFCGGTLIDKQWVLTAAHCTFDEQARAFQPAALQVLVGRRVLRSTEGIRLVVDQIIRHPAFDAAIYSNDLALLHLTEVTATSVVKLADATINNSLGQVRQGMVVGWGMTQAGVGADTLQRAQVPLVATATCRQRYADYGITLAATMICAGYEQGGVDACTGDSGGPLLVWNNRQQSWVQIGIISWGSGCAEAGVYGVYTQVSSFTEWITATINKAR